jgi:DNA-binding MarR family transcriptional regulator
VSRPQLRVLRKLAAQALTVSALREALNISSPGVTQMLDKLQALGLVSRSGSAHDQRVVLVELTPAGRNALAAAQAAFLERVRALFAPLSDEEKAQVAQLLMRAATSADPSETAHRASAKGV